ncbi:MAG: DUF5671 domain-containing protein [Candidatus Paceibacterota bacterium]
MEPTIQKSKLTPKFFFISLGVIVTLITSVSSFLILLFESLNKKFPDALNSVYQYGYNSYNFETIRASLATLIIFFPVFIFISYLWVKESNRDIGDRNIVIRKWMIYLILFLATLLIVIDLVTLVRYFISGEITTRFIFKVLGALIIAALVDFYYSLQMKNVDINFDKSKKWGLVCAIASILLFLGLIIWSFSVMGSPAKQRAWRLDDKRVADLQNIQYQVITYWQQKEKLPESLIVLANPISGSSIPVDPEFEKGKVYEYIPDVTNDSLSFQLCAIFTTDMPKGWQESNYIGAIPMYAGKSDVAVSSYPYPSGVNDSWDHKIGRTCFTRTIDKDIYPPIKK